MASQAGEESASGHFSTGGQESEESASGHHISTDSHESEENASDHISIASQEGEQSASGHFFTANQGGEESSSGHLLANVRELSAAITSGSNPSANRRFNWCAFGCALGASLTSVLIGCQLGITNEMAAFIRKDNKTEDDHIDVQTAILYILSIFGSALAGWTSDQIGRRWTILAVGYIFLAVPLLTWVASNSFLILLGRSATYIGIGYTLMVAPVYVAEISPPSSRGLFTSFPEVAITIGVILGHLSSYIFSKLEHHAQLVMVCVGALWLVPLTVTVILMPESPRWLIMKGRLDDANHVLAKISDSAQEAALWRDSIKEAAGIPSEYNRGVVDVHNTGEGVWRYLLLHPIPAIYRMLISVIGIQISRQACGADIILQYAPRLFESVGVTALNRKLVWITAVESVKMVSTIIAALLLDRAGRRRLLRISIGGMAVSLICLGACLVGIDQLDTMRINQKDKELVSKWVSGISIASLFFCVGFFSIGLGPITMVYTSEVFPLKLRARGCAIGLAANQLASLVILSLFFLLYKEISLGGAMFLFALSMCIACWFAKKFPETKGLTLETIGQLFNVNSQGRPATAEIEMQGTAGQRDGSGAEGSDS